MKSSLDILSALYQHINVEPLRSSLTGKVYIGEVPSKSQLEDISIKTLNNTNRYLQTGFINLNTYVYQEKSGRENLERFKELIDMIIPMVKDVAIDGYYFQIDDDKGIFKDQDRDGMYFYNLRLEFQTL